jgi:hypothetical protein
MYLCLATNLIFVDVQPFMFAYLKQLFESIRFYFSYRNHNSPVAKSTLGAAQSVHAGGDAFVAAGEQHIHQHFGSEASKDNWKVQHDAAQLISSAIKGWQYGYKQIAAQMCLNKLSDYTGPLKTAFDKNAPMLKEIHQRKLQSKVNRLLSLRNPQDITSEEVDTIIRACDDVLGLYLSHD